MRSFTDLGIFGAYLAARVSDVHRASQRGLHDAAKLIQEDAHHRLGTYQGSVGAVPAWQELSDRTKEEREEAGYTPNDPLLRSGALRGAIHLDVTEGKAIVGVEHGTVGSGTKDDPARDIGEIAVYQELGTHSGGRGSHGIPARPFLGPAGYARGLEAVHAISKAVGDSVAGLPYTPYKPSSFKEEMPF